MSKANRRYIDKHWLIYLLRGGLALVFGLLLLFNGLDDVRLIGLPLGIFLLSMGAIDAVSAIYNSSQKGSWINSLIDSLIDVIAALALLFLGRDSLLASVVILAVYTLASGLVDVLHGFLSTADPTDRFIRLLIGIIGCVMGLVILNAGNFEKVEFFRFFGVYAMLVGTTSLIYGVHNRAQLGEARAALREMAQERAAVGAEKRAMAHASLWRKFMIHAGLDAQMNAQEQAHAQTRSRKETASNTNTNINNTKNAAVETAMPDQDRTKTGDATVGEKK